MAAAFREGGVDFILVVTRFDLVFVRTSSELKVTCEDLKSDFHTMSIILFNFFHSIFRKCSETWNNNMLTVDRNRCSDRVYEH